MAADYEELKRELYEDFNDTRRLAKDLTEGNSFSGVNVAIGTLRQAEAAIAQAIIAIEQGRGPVRK
jgi:hypothetical protein